MLNLSELMDIPGGLISLKYLNILEDLENQEILDKPQKMDNLEHRDKLEDLVNPEH